MDPKELIERINSYEGTLPRPRFVVPAYAEVVARLSPKLEQEDVDELVALGALIKQRSSQLVPVLGEISESLGQGRAVI